MMSRWLRMLREIIHKTVGEPTPLENLSEYWQIFFIMKLSQKSLSLHTRNSRFRVQCLKLEKPWVASKP